MGSGTQLPHITFGLTSPIFIGFCQCTTCMLAIFKFNDRLHDKIGGKIKNKGYPFSLIKQIDTRSGDENMPSIKNFLFCLNTNNANGTNNVNGILCAITPEYVPGLYSFGVNFAILDLAEGTHSLHLEFKDSDGASIASIGDTPLHYTKNCNSNLPSQYVGVNVAANLQNVNIKHSGKYSMEVILDGAPLGAYEIYVKGKNESA